MHILPVSDSFADGRMSELYKHNAVLVADYNECSELCRSIETNLDRSRQQLEQAGSRLVLMGESIPDPAVPGTSVLQESYRNFAMTVALHEGKLEQAGRRLASLQEKYSCNVAQVLAISPDPRIDPRNQSDSDLADAA